MKWTHESHRQFTQSNDYKYVQEIILFQANRKMNE